MTTSRLGQVGVPAAVVMIVVMMVVPLPSALLDVLLACNLTAALLILLVCMNVRRALDFDAFPSVLLVATMFRLALNISATRLVLTKGYAGKVIEAFGHFVVGGSLVVGLVVFLILIVIQFIVITNGAGRVAEVAARFTLDAMPGKQMAIDADLNAGLINEQEARKRRAEIGAEADFYGAMDGASKFVKGDAVAAIVITTINLIGGFVIGVVQHHLSMNEAISTYSLLSVGDGLVSQIPALLISISTGLIVTRATTGSDMGTDLLMQLRRQRHAVVFSGGAVMAFGLIPGLPKIPFLLVGSLLLFAGRRIPETPDVVDAEPVEEEAPPDSPERLVQDMRVEPLELELAYNLIDLVDSSTGGDLLDRVRALRRKLALELGIVIPLVRTRDNVDLAPGTYGIRVNGVDTATGEAPPGCVLALGDNLSAIAGQVTREPVFGLPGKWVPVELRAQAEMAGATVVDRASVITTHLAEVVRTNGAKLLSREDVKMLTDMVRRTHPTVVDELTPNLLALGDVQRVLQSLLEESVSIRDLPRILEALSVRARVSTDGEGLVEAARTVLGPAISSSYAVGGRLPVITLDPLREQLLLEAVRTGDNGSFFAIEPHDAEAVALEVARVARAAEDRGDMPVLVCAGQLRQALHKLVRVAAPRLPVLGYHELATNLNLDKVGVVGGAHAHAA